MNLYSNILDRGLNHFLKELFYIYSSKRMNRAFVPRLIKTANSTPEISSSPFMVSSITSSDERPREFVKV